MKFKLAKRLLAAGMLFGSLQVSAGVISDPSGYYVNGYNGSKIGDLDMLFDSVVRSNNDGSGNVSLLAPTAANSALAAGTVIIKGKVISADIAGNLLPSAGFAKSAYTWNLWPRDGTLPAGFGQISGFAPDSTNARSAGGSLAGVDVAIQFGTGIFNP